MNETTNTAIDFFTGPMTITTTRNGASARCECGWNKGGTNVRHILAVAAAHTH